MRPNSADVSRLAHPTSASAAAMSGPSVPTANGPDFSRSLVQLAVAAFVAVVAIAAAILATAQVSLEWGIASVVLAAVASLSAVSGSPQARRAGLFLPFCFIGLWVVGYGLASLAWRDPSAELLAQNAAQLRYESLPLGLMVATVGLLAWTAGYGALNLRLVRAAVSGLRRWSTRGVAGRGPLDYSIGRIVLVYVVGLGARFVLLALGRYSYITADLQGAITQSSPIAAVLSHVEFLTTVGLLLLAFACFRSGSTRAKTLLAIVLVLELPFGLLSGMRSFLLLRLLGVGVTYVLVRRRVPAVASVAVLGVLTVLFPFTEAYRGEVRNVGRTTVGTADAADLIPTLLGSTLTEVSPRDVVLGPLDFIISRLRFVDEVAMVGQRTPSEIPYIPASESLLEATTVLVPRAIWADKPVYTVGLEYARTFWNQPESVVSARSPTYPGDAYYRGGWVALVILMALVGGLMAAVSTSLSPHLYPAAIPMFIVAWTELMNLEGSLSLLGAGLLQSLLITAVAMRWAASGRRSATAWTSSS